MIRQNLGQCLGVIDLVPMADITSTGNGTGVDIQQYDGEIAVLLKAKNVAGTTPTLDVKLQDSADGSTSWGDISGAAFTQVTDAGTKAAVSEKIVIRADQVKRYIRAVKTVGGTDSPEFLIAVTGVGMPQVLS